MEKSKTQTGIANLLLVFVIASLLALIVLALQLNSILAARRASQVRYSQTAFFAAEGALYETIQHLRDDPDWPSAFDETDYNLGGPEVDTRIKRIITQTPEGVQIEITATIKGVKRKLVTNFQRSSAERDPLDIVLIIDRSGSMDDGDTDGSGNRQPITDAISAGHAFTQVIYDNYDGVHNDRIGIVTYAEDSTVDVSLKDYPYDDVFDLLQAGHISVADYTNIGAGILKAKNTFVDDFRSEAKQFVVLLTDGCANRYFTDENTGSVGACAEWPSSSTTCTDYAITKANEIKTALPGGTGGTIYTVGLNFGWIATNVSQAVANTADNTILQIATSADHKFTTDFSENLSDIYAEIARQMVSPEFFEVEETLPEPEIEE